MLSNCKYNKVKLLHDLSSIAWFIEEHAIQDARKCSNSECVERLEHLKSHIDKLLEHLCPSSHGCQMHHEHRQE